MYEKLLARGDKGELLVNYTLVDKILTEQGVDATEEEKLDILTTLIDEALPLAVENDEGEEDE